MGSRRRDLVANIASRLGLTLSIERLSNRPLLAVLVYLFFPFPLLASTSFQPDPLMVMLFLAASLAILRHHERPTRSRFVAAALLSAAAVFVKPGIATFFVLPLFAALAIVRTGFRGAIVRPSAYVFPVLTLLPATSLTVGC